MAESMAPVVALENIANKGTDSSNTPTTSVAKLVVLNSQLVADDRITNPGVLI